MTIAEYVGNALDGLSISKEYAEQIRNSHQLGILEDVPFKSLYENSEISTRLYNCMVRSRYASLAELSTKPLFEISQIQNLGMRCIREIISLSERYLVHHNSTDDQSDEHKGAAFDRSVIDTEMYAMLHILDDDPTDDELLERFGDHVLPDLLPKPITTGNLSVRAFNCLERAGFTNMSELSGLSISQLRSVRSLGMKSLCEILRYALNECFYQADAIRPTIDAEISSETKEAAEMQIGELLSIVPDISRNVFSSAYYASFASLLTEGILPDIVTIYEKIDFYRDAVEQAYLDIVDNNVFGLDPEVDIAFPSFDTVRLQDIVYRHLENADIVEVNMYGRIERILPHVKDVFAGKDDKRSQIISCWLQGNRLSAVGQTFGVSRQRVDQIMAHIADDGPYWEDRYAYICTHYAVSASELAEYFGLDMSSVVYLKDRYKTKDELPSIDDMVFDESLPYEVRMIGKEHAEKDLLFIEGNQIPRDRIALIYFLIRQYAQDKMTYKDFSVLWAEKCHALGLDDDERFYLPVENAFFSLIMRRRLAIALPHKSFRAYDVDAQDISSLISALDLDGLSHIRLTTDKFMREYPQIMAQFDIRDEYELHSILAQTYQREGLVYERSPGMSFDGATDEEQFFDLMNELSPIDRDDLCLKYEAIYGMKARSVKASLFCSRFDHYLQGNIYDVDMEEMTDDELAYMRGALSSHDLWDIHDVNDIFHAAFPDRPLSLINGKNISDLGFSAYTGYILSKRYPSMQDYFTSTYRPDSMDIIDLDRLPHIEAHLLVCAWFPDQFAQDHFFEFRNRRYITLGRFKTFDPVVSEAFLADYRDVVYDFVADGEFFTIKYLHNKGFHHPMEEIADGADMSGTGNMLLASILSNDVRHFDYLRTGKLGSKLFVKKGTKITLETFIDHVLKDKDSIMADDLISRIEQDYGLTYDKTKIVEVIRASSRYYDGARIFRNHKTFIDSL